MPDVQLYVSITFKGSSDGTKNIPMLKQLWIQQTTKCSCFYKKYGKNIPDNLREEKKLKS